jgi:hypothetical protein
MAVKDAAAFSQLVTTARSAAPPQKKLAKK